jgi:hypothetical protein
MNVTQNKLPTVITCALGVQQECHNFERQWRMMSLHFPELLSPQADWFLSSYGLLISKHTFQVTQPVASHVRVVFVTQLIQDISENVTFFRCFI